MVECAIVGKDKGDIDTPALLIDLDVLEKNIKTMADYYRQKKGAALLPHQKGHRLPIIGRKQLDAGAKGVSMTSLGLAEYYVSCGIMEILITSEISGQNKIRRLCSLGKHADIAIGVDNIENVRELSEMALADNTRINVAVELSGGPVSCGVDIAKAKSFVKKIAKFKGVNFKGLWWHEGGGISGIRSWEERKRVNFEYLDRVATLRDEIEDAGVNVEMLSGGYTCTWNITPEYHGLKDVGVQAGSYVFSDWVSHELEWLEVFGYGLTVLTRCMSMPKPNQALFDFGLNTCSHEATDDYHKIVGPVFKDLEGVQRIDQREEISSVSFKESCARARQIRLGGAYELVPPHSDTTAKLYDKYYCIRNGKVEDVWLNLGRGLF